MNAKIIASLAFTSMFSLSTLLSPAHAEEQEKALNFGIISTESQQNLKPQWTPFLQDMEKKLGVKVNAFFAPDYAGIIQGMRFNKVDIAWYGNLSAMEAVDRANGQVFAQTVAAEKLKELKVIWKSPLIPGDPIVWRKNLSETTKDKIYDFFMNYGKTPEEKAVLERLGWAPFRASSDLQLVPIRQLALFKEMQGVKSNKGLNEQDKLAKTTEIQAQLDDLDRLNNALSAMSSVSKAVQ
ncbi:TPA: phosphate/phosphite/phosphonate ABC transporter substrate-binding protein [Escherichia coli]